MAAKKTGISRDLLIHPGETIADVIEDRGITQAELAKRAGVTSSYVSEVISGKKGISANFAMGLEYALGVKKSFWLNLQANYEAELLEVNEEESITDDERKARNSLKSVVSYLRKKGEIPNREGIDQSILSLRKALHMSNLSDLQSLVPAGAFRISRNVKTDPYVLGAWIQLCQMDESYKNISTKFDKDNIQELIDALKNIMCSNVDNPKSELEILLAKYGIAFSIVRYFTGAPVQGYIFKRTEGIYQLDMTTRGAFADIFWFSLFHEIGHIVNGDLAKSARFLDLDDKDNKSDKEKRADLFAKNTLLSPDSYDNFIGRDDFSVEAIEKYAGSQRVMPFVVIGRLQKEGYISYSTLSTYKIKYKWGE